MATRKTNRAYQYEPLITPSGWHGDEQRYAVRLNQLLDDIYNKLGGRRNTDGSVELGMYSFYISSNGHLICEYDTDNPPPLSIDSSGHLIWTVDSGNTVDLGRVVGEGSGGVSFEVDETLTLTNGVLSVNTTDAAAESDTRPITAQGVYNEFAVINALLKTI